MNNAIIMDGRTLAKEIEGKLRLRADNIKDKTGTEPMLVAILVGNNPASASYVNMKMKACERIGTKFLRLQMPEDTTTEELLAKIEELNSNDEVHGILLQHPVPVHIDEQRCFDAIKLRKDVDGVSSATFGKMSIGLDSFMCAAALGLYNLLKGYDIKVQGKQAVIAGCSCILGKPIAAMLLNENATVTICHADIKNLKEVIGRADIVVGAIESPRFIKADWIKEGAVLLDTGYNPGNLGDIDLENAIPKCSAYTPVPGGIGPMTIASLLQQTIQAAEKASDITIEEDLKIFGR